MSTVDEPVQPQMAPAHPTTPYASGAVAPQYGHPAPQASYGEQAHGHPAYGQQPHGQPQHLPVGYAPAPLAPVTGPLGPVGKVRSTWAVIGLSIITFGIYSLYYYFATHEEMKQHSGDGVGGALGLVIALFTFGLVTPFLLPNEVGNLYARQQRTRPVSATTGLWVLLGWIILVGPLVWLIKTNGALNAYWRSMGAR